MVLATRCGTSFTKGHSLAGVRGLTGLVVVGLLAACGDRPAPEPGSEAAAPAAVLAAAAEPFVVFTSSSLTIDRLDVPVPAPVTVGSSPSPLTLASDAPEVVSIDAAGALVGHKAGRARIRTLDGRAALDVEVRPISAFALVPARLTLRPGGKGRLRIVAAGSGEELPAEGAQWVVDAPGVALVIAGEVEAGPRPGVANVLVRYGGQTARAAVAVEVVRSKPEVGQAAGK